MYIIYYYKTIFLHFILVVVKPDKLLQNIYGEISWRLRIVCVCACMYHRTKLKIIFAPLSPRLLTSEHQKMQLKYKRKGGYTKLS